MRTVFKGLAAGTVVFALLALLTVPPLRGQTIDYGKLTGTITDETGEPLPGVAVEVSGPALISGKRAGVTSARGTYVFLNLPIGRYTLTASIQGFKTLKQENITVSAAESVTVDLKLEAGRIEESVTVTAVSPVVDAKSSLISTNLASELLSKLPTSRDAFYDLSLATPGMVSQGKDGDWLPSPSAYGGTSNENVFLINGINTTNPRAAAYGSLVKVNYNAVEEVRVIALGSKAEYGSFTGVAIDVITKSGSNAFHGNASVYSMLGKAADNTPGADSVGNLGSMGATNYFIGEGDQVVKRNIKDFEGNFTLGGPLIRDKVWFYGGFDYVKAETQVPFFKVNSKYWGRFGDFKLSSEPFANHRAWAAYHYENNDTDGTTWSPHWDPTMYYGTATISHSVSAQWQWMLSGKTVVTAKYLGFWNNDKPHIPSDAPANPGYINWWKWGTFGVNGNFPYVEAQKSSRNTVQVDISHYAEDFLGEHDIKFGVQYTMGRGNWEGGYFQGYANFAYPAPWTQNINYLKSWYGATGLIFYNRQTWLNPFLTVRTSDQLGGFFDDQWTPTKRLTVNLGLRFDNMRAKYGEGKVYQNATKPEDINGPPPVIRTRQGTDSIFNFNNLAPRIGLTYALTKDMKTVVRANFGRYFLPISVEYLRRFGPDMEGAVYKYIFYNVPFNLVDLNHNNYVDPDEMTSAARYLHDPKYRSPGDRPSWWAETENVDYSWKLNVAGDLKNQYTDQITLNIERELVSNLSLSLTYINKNTHNLFVNWPLNRETGQPFEYVRVPYTSTYGRTINLYDIVLKDYNGDGVANAGDIGWIGSHIDREVRNIGTIDGVKPRRLYQGLQLMLNKRFSNRWQALASILFSWSDGMAARTIRQDFNFEGPMVMDTNWVAGLNELIGAMDGPLPFTQKYEIKISGSYRIPWLETDLGFRYRYNPGRPIWPLDAYPVWAQWSATRPTGAVINTGGNYVVAIDPTDPYYLPHESILDLRLDKTFTVSKFGTMRLAIDMLNIMNANAVTNAGYGGSIEPVIGRVSGVTFPSRKFRLSVGFEF